VYNFGATILRSVGNSKIPLFILGISGLVNVLFNLLFVIVFHLSIAGVAIATIISQYMSAIAVILILVFKRGECYQLSFKNLRIEKRLLVRILRFGIPASIQSSLFGISNLVITYGANMLPKYMVSAKTIAGNVDNIVYVIMNAYLHAATTFVGQNYGAQKHRRLNRVVVFLVCQALVVGILSCGGIFLVSHNLAQIFVAADDEAKELVLASCAEIFKVMLGTYFLCGVMETISGILRGVGYSVSSTVASLLGLLSRVSWVLFVFPGKKTLFYLYVSYPISWVLTILISIGMLIYIWHKLEIFKKAKLEKIKETEKVTV
jgi:Na+-driven multidrug efflux pump